MSETTTELPPKKDRFAGARAAKAAIAAQKKAEAAKPAANKYSLAEAAKATGPSKYSIAPAAIKPLPAPGDYNGEITEIGLFDKGDHLLMRVNARLESGDECEPSWGTIALAAGSSKTADDLRRGQRLLNQLAASAGVTIPPDIDPFDLDRLLEGKKVKIQITHRVIDGVPGLSAQRFVKG